MGIYLIIGLAGSAVFVGLGAWMARRWQRHRLKKVRTHGRNQEKKAPKMMTRRGYTVEAIHPEKRYTWWIDGEPREVRLEADMLVSKHGKLYLVEVKTRKSASPKNILTRRQILEYSLHFPVDGLLLLDADQDQLYDLKFPDFGHQTQRSFGLIMGMILGALIAIIMMKIINISAL